MPDTKSDRAKTKNNPNLPSIILPQAELGPNVYSPYFDFQNKENPSLFLDGYYYVDKQCIRKKGLSTNPQLLRAISPSFRRVSSFSVYSFLLAKAYIRLRELNLQSTIVLKIPIKVDRYDEKPEPLNNLKVQVLLSLVPSGKHLVASKAHAGL